MKCEYCLPYLLTNPCFTLFPSLLLVLLIALGYQGTFLRKVPPEETLVMPQTLSELLHAGQFLTAIKDGLKEFLSISSVYSAARKSLRAVISRECFIPNGMKKRISA